MARRSRERTRTIARDKAVPGYIQQSGDIASLAFARVRTYGSGALAWLGGFRAGFHGVPYVRPLGRLDPQAWTLGFIEGRGHRGKL
jgi:hypothetical protein